MRGRVIEAARSAGLEVGEQPLWTSDIEGASEVFITNALRGIRPVVALGDTRWPVGEVASLLASVVAPWKAAP
jgi:branched-subunit amino acid aminotransferase/4-amino-4-deoxychorismate lyase